MASVKDTASFFANGTTKQFDYCFKLYPQVLKLKAEARCKKPDELVRLDDWYQNELPKRIKQRGKDAHMVHEELVQTMKWKQSRGKYFPQLSYLVKVNTPRAVMQETKKAFRKLPNLEQAITALSNLKGVGTTMASALLAAAAPDSAPFMADECLMAIPEIEGIDYTTKEYLNFVQHIQTTVNRLNSEKDSTSSWSPHRVELALWTHYVATDLKPELLDDLPQSGIMNLSTKKFSTTGDDIDDTDDDDNKNGIVDDDVDNNIKIKTTTTTTTSSSSSSSSSTSNNTIIIKQTNGGSIGVVGSGISNNINDTDENSISNESQDENDITINKDAKIINNLNVNNIITPIGDNIINNSTTITATNNDHDDDDVDDDDDEDDDDDDDDDDNDNIVNSTIVTTTTKTTSSSTINLMKSNSEQQNKLQKNSSKFISPTLAVDDATTASSTTTIDDDTGTTTNTIEQSDESNLELLQIPANGNNGNGALDSLDESTRSEDSLEKPITPIVANDETNDSDSYISSAKRSLDCESSESNSQPELKKIRSE